MPCFLCASQFTVFKRKRSCADCKRSFCSSCLEKKHGSILCVKCLIFASNPSKLELLKLKTKDLIFFLQSKHVSTSGIVEKEELVNLVLHQIRIQSGNTGFSSNQSTPNSDFDGYSNSFDQIKNTCQNFITSFTDKIASDLHKTTCFTPPPQQKNTVHSTQPRPNQSNQNTANSPYVPEFRPSAPTPTTRQRNLEVNSNTSNGASNISSATTSPMFSHQNESAASSRLVSPRNYSHLGMQDGCECTDDEGEEQAVGGVKDKQNVMPDEMMPGPSGCSSSSGGTTSSHKPVKRSNSNESSSFEDLAIGATSSDETWQFVEKTENVDNNPEKVPEMAKSTAQAAQQAKITRRRSDSSILLNMHKSKSVIQIDPCLEASTVKKLKVSCHKCGKAKSSIKKEIAKLRSQLEASNKTEEEVNARIYEFLNYLEAKSRSPDYTDSEESHASQDCGTAIPVSMSNDEIQETVFDENFGIHVYGSEADEQAANSNAKRFMQLDDITSSEELELLTVKQLKEILMLNRVDYKGCCEKNELKERVLRLWQHHMAAPAPDKISSEELCKICFDAPIECVLLECGHMATCLNCGKTMNECPICRQYIVRVVRFFKS